MNCGNSSMLNLRRILPTARDTGIFANFEQHSAVALIERQQLLNLPIRAVDHGPEFEHGERLSIQTNPFGRVENRAFTRELDSDSRRNEQWRCPDKRSQREAEVEPALLKAFSPLVLRLFHMQQWEAGDGPQR